VSEPTIAELASSVQRLRDESDERLRVELADRLSPQHRLGSGAPATPEVGYTPFTFATVVGLGVVDWSTLAAGLLAFPVASTHAIPTKGTASTLPVSDHDHGLVKGPPLEGLAVTYSGPGVPTTVVRTDTPGGVVASSVITYAGTQVASVVTTRSGYTITVTPTYTGTDITSISRVVA
jgi:hypothetical protein